MVKHMKYPNNIKKNYKKEINYKNRGMDLENLINEACKYYLEHNLAVIYKKPTPKFDTCKSKNLIQVR